MDFLPECIAGVLTAGSGQGGGALSQSPRARHASTPALVEEWESEVVGTLSQEKAEVTAGGVPLSEVNASTLESRVVQGLYLWGEVPEVEGRLEGLDFQWAWSGGPVARRSAGR